MNRTPNATEIRLSEPIASAANPAVSARPAASVARIAPTSFTERNAANRIAHTRTTDRMVDLSAPSRRVANCSSSSATGPVMRTPHAVLRVERQLAGQPADLGARPAPGLERVEVEHRARSTQSGGAPAGPLPVRS